jgi:hypothetical protein
MHDVLFRGGIWVRIYGERSVLWLRESPKEYTPAAPLLITTLAHSACQAVFGGRNPGKWTAAMQACFSDAINVVLVFELHVMQARVGQLLQQG